MTTLPNARRQKIIDLLESKDYAEISYLSSVFNVSEMTIRRDLERLEKEDQVIRVYGGVKLKTKHMFEDTIVERLKTNSEAKRLIAQEAIKMIKEGDVIAFDASTSALEVSKLVKKHFNSLTVVTNNISIALELSDAKNIAVILLGGYVRGSSLSTIGASLQLYLQSIYIDKLFISSRSLNFDEGLTDTTSDEGEAKQAMIRKSSEVVVLADRTKLGKVAFFKVCTNDTIGKIITDGIEPLTEAQKNLKRDYEQIGTEVIVAGESQSGFENTKD